ncbi:MAG: DNA mismatch endonuclease Vsr [Acidobacteriaceae bacterium]
MTDTLSRKARSERMALIHNKDTKPEMTVRKLIHRLGYRYRLHSQSLPGKPDLIFPSRNKVIFVHGCFWHRHQDSSCRLARMPKSRLGFWRPKLERNRLRDGENIKKLGVMGWKPLIIWECQLTNLALLSEQVRSFLDR